MDQDSLFSDEILRAVGLADAPEEERDDFLERASEAILAAVVKKIAAALPADKKEEFFALFEQPSTDEAKTAFFKTYVPDFNKIIVDELTRFKSEAIANAKSADGETASATPIKK